jgi:hypothetical protein
MEKSIQSIVDSYTIKKDNKWKDEESREIPTLRNSILKITRIIYDGENPPKRCLALSKNRRTLAFDIELVPIVLATMIVLTPEELIPNNEFRNILKKLRAVVMKTVI